VTAPTVISGANGAKALPTAMAILRKGCED